MSSTSAMASAVSISIDAFRPPTRTPIETAQEIVENAFRAINQKGGGGLITAADLVFVFEHPEVKPYLNDIKLPDLRQMHNVAPAARVRHATKVRPKAVKVSSQERSLLYGAAATDAQIREAVGTEDKPAQDKEVWKALPKQINKTATRTRMDELIKSGKLGVKRGRYGGWYWIG